MSFDVLDGALALAAVAVIIWMALKIATRLILGVILVVVIAVVFFGVNLSDFGINLGQRFLARKPLVCSRRHTKS